MGLREKEVLGKRKRGDDGRSDGHYKEHVLHKNYFYVNGSQFIVSATIKIFHILFPLAQSPVIYLCPRI